MPHRSPTRFLAPVALFLAVLTVFLVTRSELGSDGSSRSASSSTTPAETAARGSDGKKRASTTRTGATGASGGKAKAKTYTVKPGDVLGSIAESTGVPVADLLEYNDIDDAQNLSVGQKLKLEP